MKDYFVFDGVDCRDFGVHAFVKNAFSAPTRSYTDTIIPARNGSVLIDGRRYDNAETSYTCVIYEDLGRNLPNFREFLLSRVGYKRLEDSINPDEFYQACYMSAFEPVVDTERKRCKVQVIFKRKPQRFLRSGEIPITIGSVSASKIHNPCRFSSQPLIRVYGTGQIQIDDQMITVSSNYSEEYIDIDCDVMVASYDGQSENQYVSFSGNEFPVLHEGINNIELSGGVTQVVITPRWFRM